MFCQAKQYASEMQARSLKENYKNVCALKENIKKYSLFVIAYLKEEKMWNKHLRLVLPEILKLKILN